MELTRQQLNRDLWKAYYRARKEQRNSSEQLLFELDLENNMASLEYAVWTRTYEPGPCDCFVVNEKVKREVFAPRFRGLHHSSPTVFVS